MEEPSSDQSQAPADGPRARRDLRLRGLHEQRRNAPAVNRRGAGATFPALLYQVWIEKFNEANSNVTIDYESIGSGGGIKAITQQTVDFGASDAAM